MMEEILKEIESAGIDGMKKADLKKTHGKDYEQIIERLSEKEQIFIEKKGTAYFVWTRENYIQHITQNDPKFKLMFNMLLGVSHSLARVQAHAETLQEELERYVQGISSLNDDFEGIFNRSIKESATSMGWVSFDRIRRIVCENQNISKEKFYQMVIELIEKHREKYEISSGGQEGVMMRGLVHGYVRNI